mmetsp:Transcript_1728/g.2353  ORF Transcript_1728/g.2353 Transcript_1728/m.2353 type:complete len:177 (-) Transcript_1728:57-587(-)
MSRTIRSSTLCTRRAPPVPAAVLLQHPLNGGGGEPGELLGEPRAGGLQGVEPGPLLGLLLIGGGEEVGEEVEHGGEGELQEGDQDEDTEREQAEHVGAGGAEVAEVGEGEGVAGGTGPHEVEGEPGVGPEALGAAPVEGGGVTEPGGPREGGGGTGRRRFLGEKREPGSEHDFGAE